MRTAVHLFLRSLFEAAGLNGNNMVLIPRQEQKCAAAFDDPRVRKTVFLPKGCTVHSTLRWCPGDGRCCDTQPRIHEQSPAGYNHPTGVRPIPREGYQAQSNCSRVQELSAPLRIIGLTQAATSKDELRGVDLAARTMLRYLCARVKSWSDSQAFSCYQSRPRRLDDRRGAILNNGSCQRYLLAVRRFSAMS